MVESAPVKTTFNIPCLALVARKPHPTHPQKVVTPIFNLDRSQPRSASVLCACHSHCKIICKAHKNQLNKYLRFRIFFFSFLNKFKFRSYGLLLSLSLSLSLSIYLSIYLFLSSLYLTLSLSLSLSIYLSIHPSPHFV